MYTKYLKNNKKLPVFYSTLPLDIKNFKDEFVLLFSSTSIFLFYKDYEKITCFKNYKSLVFKSSFLNEKYSKSYFEKKENQNLDLDIYPFLAFFNTDSINLTFEEMENILEKFYFIKDKLKYQREKYWPCLIKSTLYELLTKITNLYFEKLHNNRKYEFDVVEVKTYLEKSYFEEITISSLCDNFYVNRDKLQKSFKISFGHTPINYLNKIRIERAKVLLINTKLPITLIVEKVGFNSISNFNKKFKEEVGLNPSSYKKSHSIFQNR